MPNTVRDYEIHSAVAHHTGIATELCASKFTDSEYIDSLRKLLTDVHFEKKAGLDWCHVCREPDKICIGIAEKEPSTRYVRICKECIGRAAILLKII